ncbi:methyltransferase domain-containing protein [Salinisphaera sp.]|uniref:methyltransferase domain-containing protein n=1 Tax=Salinisphaera sp. TaxID=1914330 RepID=UPI002D78B2CC|nr:methyltransferase domain-containing protein [Salinisphaera sp.]HET7315585.1 methyltransferase domain-containing protein [Salinisphaera sp.]
MTGSAHYPKNFYRGRDDRSAHAAGKVLTQLAEILPPVHSVTDYGCGVGTWLAAARTIFDTTDIKGFEGPWLDPGMLVIDKSQFEHCDLAASDRPSARASDLTLCLEVAEHLSAPIGDDLVRILAKTSDFILFSAAIPNQGGKGHVNEQWPDYWTERFADRGFTSIAPFRHRLWNDADISPWYRQNLLLVANRSRLDALTLDEAELRAPVLPVVHPEIFRAALARQQAQIDKLVTVTGAWRALRRALRGKPYRVRPHRAQDPRDNKNASA